MDATAPEAMSGTLLERCCGADDVDAEAEVEAADDGVCCCLVSAIIF